MMIMSQFNDEILNEFESQITPPIISCIPLTQAVNTTDFFPSVCPFLSFCH